MDWTPSDYALMACFGLATFLAAYFALGEPRVWHKDPLGWVLFSYSVMTFLFLGLIAYAIVFEQKVAEPWRFAVGAGMALALSLKIFAIHRERVKGRITPDQSPTGRNSLMSTPDVSLEEIKDVSTIWFKAQRVLRSIVGTLISALTVWAALAAIFPQVLAELATVLPGPAIAWLTGVIAAVSAVAGAISRIMAIPKVNAFLTKWLNLGSIPKQNITAKNSPVNGNVVVTVEPDRKALRNG